MKCAICQKEVHTHIKHITEVHGMTFEAYFLQYLSKTGVTAVCAHPKCHKPAKFNPVKPGYNTFCSPTCSRDFQRGKLILKSNNPPPDTAVSEDGLRRIKVH